jgi:serine/threonine kinase PknH
VKSSADKWKFCPGRNLTATYTDGAVHRWQFGKLTGAPPKIAPLTAQEGTDGGACQRVLRAVSNVVLDVDACAGMESPMKAARSPTRWPNR